MPTVHSTGRNTPPPPPPPAKRACGPLLAQAAAVAPSAGRDLQTWFAYDLLRDKLVRVVGHRAKRQLWRDRKRSTYLVIDDDVLPRDRRTDEYLKKLQPVAEAAQARSAPFLSDTLKCFICSGGCGQFAWKPNYKMPERWELLNEAIQRHRDCLSASEQAALPYNRVRCARCPASGGIISVSTMAVPPAASPAGPGGAAPAAAHQPQPQPAAPQPAQESGAQEVLSGLCDDVEEMQLQVCRGCRSGCTDCFPPNEINMSEMSACSAEEFDTQRAATIAVLTAVNENWTQWVNDINFHGTTIWACSDTVLVGALLEPRVFELKALACKTKGTGRAKKLLRRWIETTIADAKTESVIVLEATNEVLT